MLLGNTPVPGYDDPRVIEGRPAELAAAAVRTGELFVELLVRLRAERANGMHMSETGCVTLASNALLALHKAMVRWREVEPDDGPRALELAG
jgi:hypothetical protein